MRRPSQVSGSHKKDSATVHRFPIFAVCSFVIHRGCGPSGTSEKRNKSIRINESQSGADGKEKFRLKKKNHSGVGDGKAVICF